MAASLQPSSDYLCWTRADMMLSRALLPLRGGWRSVARPEVLPYVHLDGRVLQQGQQRQQHSTSISPRAASSYMANLGCAPMVEPVMDPTTYIPGRADQAGTTFFAQKVGSNAGPGHFRYVKVGGQVGDLLVSSLGIGTFWGSEYDEVDKEYIQAITRCFQHGINVIDTASNYRSMRSELAIGECILRAIKQGIINRNEVIVSTKGGFLSFDYRESVEPRTYIEDKYVKTGLFKWEEFIGGVHCLSTPFVINQLEISRRNLGLQTIDIYYIHNPEIEMGVVSRPVIMSRLKSLFAALEKCAQEGKISMYGVSSWNAFRVTSGSKNSLSLEELVKFAIDAGGENHHFRVVMAPYNLKMQDIANNPTQVVKGKRLPLLHAAGQLGINVVASAPLFQGILVKHLTPDVKDKFPELGDRRTHVQCALQFSRTTPGILTTLSGMSKVPHVEENAAIIRFPAMVRG